MEGQDRGQGAFEYLLLIGAAIILTTITIVLVINSSSSTVVDQPIESYQNSLQIATGFSLDSVEGNQGDPLDTTSPSLALDGKWDDALITLSYSVDDNPSPSGPLTFVILRSTDPNDMNSIQITSPTNFFIPSGVTTILFNTTPTSITANYADSGLSNGTVYSYRLAACDNAAPNNCSLSNIYTATPKIPEILFSFGPEEMVLDAGNNGLCAQLDIPDNPPKAYRFNGKIFMIAGNAPDNYIVQGDDFDSLNKICGTISLASDKSDSASTHNNYEWLWSSFVENGKVHALLHNEFHDPNHPGSCAGSTSLAPGNPCWYNTLTTATSTDGINFTQSPSPTHVAAGPPLQWDHVSMNTSTYGFIEPSNIIKVGSYYYVFTLGIMTPGSPEAGMCLLRTNNLEDSSSWRAWDGSDFTISMPSPYPIQVSTPCVPVDSDLQALRGTVTYNSTIGKYIMVNIGQGWEGGTYSCGWFYSLSNDLIDWTPLKKLLPFDAPYGVVGDNKPNCLGGFNFGATFNMYGDLIDHDSLDPNFNTSGASPHLYWVRINNYQNPSPFNRDLMRMRMDICMENDPTCNP